MAITLRVRLQKAKVWVLGINFYPPHTQIIRIEVWAFDRYGSREILRVIV